ncbi:hypothetical protein CCX46_24415 [Pseudomonas sp. RU47]|uniref:hypothetical protein n=1 Tax=Pseudomonas sp. RU47 TaxID=2005388 RepID=UPI000FDD3E4C|nr:hypothetical protein [Pseudomonas sp. RU47]AZZ78153.1 hypothetical protein CCX46_24415 [Pseudomonas sp. RU47]
MSELCYMCDKPGTTVEHVPPKCLFPELKDAGVNFRLNLITVPSCEEHNCKKSVDDEFLMVSIAGILGNNSIGFEHYNGKIQRSLKRTSYKLLEKVFLKKRLVRLGSENKFIDILWGTPDYKRLIDCFTHIAYGIHRHHFKANFIGSTKAYLGFLHTNVPNPKAFKAFIKEKASLELADKTKYGDNPGVFYYQYTEPDMFGIFLVRLCFYQNVDVYVAYMPSTAEKPFHLGFELMNLGYRTIITLGDKEFEFNSGSDPKRLSAPPISDSEIK